MRDEFAGVRLPDLPSDGYSTRREKALSDEIMFFLRGVERNRRLLLKIVLGGKEQFRKIGRNAWRHLRVDTELCDAVYGYMVLLAGPQPALQLQSLDAYEAQTMAQRIWNQNEKFLRVVHRKTQKH